MTGLVLDDGGKAQKKCGGNWIFLLHLRAWFCIGILLYFLNGDETTDTTGTRGGTAGHSFAGEEAASENASEGGEEGGQ